MPKRQQRPHPFPGTGARIREARLAHGMTCEALGDLVGSNKGLVSGWELDKVWPQESKLALLEQALGIELPRRDRNATGRASTRTAVCPICDKTFPVFFGEVYCSRTCAGEAKREAMIGRNVKGGYTIDPSGYVHLLMPEYPNADPRGYIREHRVVMEEKIGRLLMPGERVHHKDGDRSNNHPDNLELWHIKGIARKDHPAGQRTVDLINVALDSDSLHDMPEFWREATRRSLLLTFLGDIPATADGTGSEVVMAIEATPRHRRRRAAPDLQLDLLTKA